MGCFPWLCHGHYKKTKRSHHKTQGGKHEHQRRAQDKKKAIPQRNIQAEHHKHQIELPVAQCQETQRVDETSLASILAMANFGSSTPSPNMDKQSSSSPETATHSTFGYPIAGSPESVPPPPRPPPSGFPGEAYVGRSWEASAGADESTAAAAAAAATAPLGVGGGGTVYVHPRSMAHAHFLVVDHTRHRGPPATYSALIPTGGRVSDLVAALAPAHAGVALWARTEGGGCHALPRDRSAGGPLARGSLHALHRAACQLEVWPAAATTKPPPAKTAATAGERIRKLERELEEARRSERDEAKKKAARRASSVYPAAAPVSWSEAPERTASGRRPAPAGNIWIPNNSPTTTYRHKW